MLRSGRIITTEPGTPEIKRDEKEFQSSWRNWFGEEPAEGPAEPQAVNGEETGATNRQAVLGEETGSTNGQAERGEETGTRNGKAEDAEMDLDLKDELRRLTHRMEQLQPQRQFAGEQGHFNSNAQVKPPAFNGRAHENIYEFAQKFENFCDFQGWNGQKRASALPLYLSGLAWNWHAELEPEVKADSRLVLAAMRAKFHNRALQRVDEQSLYTRVMVPGENLECYIEDVLQRFARLQKGENEQLGPFIHGLSPQLKSFVISKGPATVGEAVDQARLADSIYRINPTFGAPLVPTGPSVSQVSPTTTDSGVGDALKALVCEVRTLTKEIRQRPLSSMVGAADYNGPRRETSECNFCHKKGHNERDCYTKERLKRDGCCFRCRKPGHIGRNCKETQRSEN